MNSTHQSKFRFHLKKGLLPGLLMIAALSGAPAIADTYPSKPIRIVVAFPAGGGSDLMARTVGEKLSASLKQPVIVENRPGAGGTVGAAIVARAPADGYTILLGQTANLAVAPALMSNVGYDPVKDFAPITQLVRAPLVLVGSKSLPAENLKELITLAKSKPGTLNYASPGNGTTGHLSGELFKKQANIDIAHIPYKGQAPIMTDLLGNRISVYFSTIAVMAPYITSGQVKAFAVTSRQRSAALPNVSTMEEGGVQGAELDSWFGLFAPAKTPDEIIGLLNAEVKKILTVPEIRQQLSKEGGDVVGDSPQEFRRLMEVEVPRWEGIVRDAKAKVD